MTDVYTAALLLTKPSSDDDPGFRHGFGAEPSLPLTQSARAVCVCVCLRERERENWNEIRCNEKEKTISSLDWHISLEVSCYQSKKMAQKEYKTSHNCIYKLETLVVNETHKNSLGFWDINILPNVNINQLEDNSLSSCGFPRFSGPQRENKRNRKDGKMSKSWKNCEKWMWWLYQ